MGAASGRWGSLPGKGSSGEGRCCCCSSGFVPRFSGRSVSCREGAQRSGLQAYRSAARLPSSRLTRSSPAPPQTSSHLASRAPVCLQEKLNGEMQIPYNKLKKLVAAVAPAEPGLGLGGTCGKRSLGTSLVRGERAGGAGQPGPRAAARGILSLARPHCCSLSPEMARFSHDKQGGGVATLPQQPRPCTEQMEPILNAQSQQKRSQ